MSSSRKKFVKESLCFFEVAIVKKLSSRGGKERRGTVGEPSKGPRDKWSRYARAFRDFSAMFLVTSGDLVLYVIVDALLNTLRTPHMFVINLKGDQRYCGCWHVRNPVSPRRIPTAVLMILHTGIRETRTLATFKIKRRGNTFWWKFDGAKNQGNFVIWLEQLTVFAYLGRGIVHRVRT